MTEKWKRKTLGEVCQFRGGGTPSKAIQGYWSGNIPWVSPKDMKFDVISDSMDHITPDAIKGSATSLIPKGSVLIVVRSGILARTIPIAVTGCDLAINQDLKALCPHGEVDAHFLYYFLCSRMDLILSMVSRGATVHRLMTDQIRSLELLLPSLSEQQRIVAILDEAFDGIATAKANAEKNLKNARELFESHLQAVFAQRNKEWIEKGVGDLVAEGALLKPFDGNHGEIHPKKSDYVEAGVPFIMASDLNNGIVDFDHCKHISRRLADSLRVGFAIDGDVLISHKGTIGRSAVLRTSHDYIMLTPQVTSYRIKNKSVLCSYYLRFYFMSRDFQSALIKGAEDGATRAYIGITKQLSLKIRFTSVKEQREIADKISLLNQQVQRLESLYKSKLAALDELKKSLLHKAFSGQL